MNISAIKTNNCYTHICNKKTLIKNNNSNLNKYSYSNCVNFSAKIELSKEQRLKRAHGYIHAAAIAAATTAAAMAQTPGADTAALTAITIAMSNRLCSLYDIKGTSTLGAGVLAWATGRTLGTDTAMKLVSWIPAIGNGANATATFLLHEATGWTMVALFENLRQNGRLDEQYRISKEQINSYKNKGKELKKETNTPFKGIYNISQQNNIKKLKQYINKYAIKHNLENNNTNNLAEELSNKLCETYQVNKNSKTAKTLKEFIKMSNNKIINESYKLQEFSDSIKEDIYDVSYITPFWILVSILENAKKQNKNLNDIDISQKTIIKNSKNIINILKQAA